MMKIATVFSGIGAAEQALKRMGIKHEVVFACDNGNIEIDYDADKELAKIKNMNSKGEKQKYVDILYDKGSKKKNYVKMSYLSNYTVKENKFYQDIRLLDGNDYKGEVDIFVGGSPCQSFSTVGDMQGLDDIRGTLFFDYARLISEIQPKVFIYENVRGLYTHDKGKTWEKIKRTFDKLGYKYYYDILDAKDYGIPQTRRRLFVVGFKNNVDFIFPEKKQLKFKMQDFLEESTAMGSFLSKNGMLDLEKKPGSIDPKYYLSEKLQKYVMCSGTKSFYQKPVIDLEIARTILATMGNRHRAGTDNYTQVNGKIRMLTEREAHRLMGFPDNYKIIVSRAQAYKQAGNSIVVDVMMNLLATIIATKEV